MGKSIGRTGCRIMAMLLMCSAAIYGVGGGRLPAASAAADATEPSAWTAAAMAAPAPGSGFQAAEVSCASTTFCMAVGSYESGSSATQEFIERWDGVTWTASPGLVNVNGNALYGISCPTSTFCIAVGQVYLDTPTPSASATPLVEEWNGSTWSAMAQPAVLAQNNGQINAVSCPRPSFCMAVGSYANTPGGPWLNLTETWNGVSWTLQNFADPAFAFSGAGLASLSCASATFCEVSTAAVPNASSAFLAMWDGTRWTGTTAAGLLALSCPTTSFCMGLPATALGQTSALAEEFNGVSWTAVSPPASPVAAMSCTSATFCMAVGYREFAANLSSSLWTGGPAWDSDTPPTVAGQVSASLDTVSCPSPSECVAVGASTANPASPGTLTSIFSDVWLAPGTTITPPVSMNLSLVASPTLLQVGATATLTATLTDSTTGSPVSNTLITFGALAGPDKGSFAVVMRTDARGRAVATLKGTTPGTDSLVAWVDANTNGRIDPGEPADTANLLWMGTDSSVPEWWAGYVLTNAPSAPLQASITVSQLSCNQPGRSDSWIGYDGFNATNTSLNTTVEQVGLEEDCLKIGMPSYGLWYELYGSIHPREIAIHPKARHAFRAFEPGDIVSLQVSHSGASVSFSVVVRSSTGILLADPWSKTISTTQMRPAPAYESAECVTEDPLSPSREPLADFTTMHFTGCSVIDSAQSGLGILTPLEMLGRSGTELASTGLFSRDAASVSHFQVTWLAHR